MTEYFAQPDDAGDIRASQLRNSLGESLGAQAADTLDPDVRGAVRRTLSDAMGGFEVARHRLRLALVARCLPLRGCSARPVQVLLPVGCPLAVPVECREAQEAEIPTLLRLLQPVCNFRSNWRNFRAPIPRRWSSL